MCAERRPKLSDVIASKPNTPLEERSDAAANLLAWARCHDTKAKGSGGLVQVAPGLYLGNKMAAADANLLACKGVVGVCAVGARQVFPGDGHHVSIEDDGAESMLPHFEAACSFIEQHRRRGAVLVHCKGGISRSPTMVIAYLMRHEQLSLADAMEVCCLARPAARPREIFLRDLRLWEEKLIEDRRWQKAVELANGHTLESLQPREPGNSKAEVQSECRRLLDLLQEHCILEAFGEPRETSWQLREAAREAVTDFAESRGWKSLARKQSSIQQEQASSG